MFMEKFDKLKYQSLSLRDRPFVFAYSSLITEQVKQQCKDAGFDDSFSGPMTV